MTELILVVTEKSALQEKEKAKERAILEPRIERLEKELNLVKAKMEARRGFCEKKHKRKTTH